jgi:hypothetical protein
MLRAWTEVAKDIFPRRETINGRQVRWMVHQELCYGPSEGIELDKPQAIFVKRMHSHQDAQPSHDTVTRYSWLMIEASPPQRDIPEGWKELLMQACSRVCQPTFDNGVHDIYVVCVAGLKFMAFYWDPKNAGNATQQLRLSVAGQEARFPSQLTPVPDCSPHVPSLQADGSPDQYRINVSRVWSIDPEPIDIHARAMGPLTALESFMTRSRTTLLQNPAPYNT